MLRTIGLLTLVLTLATSIVASAQTPVFKHDAIARDGARYEAWLKKNWKAGQEPAARHRSNGYSILRQGNDPRAASREFAQAIVAEPADAPSWMGLARALLAIPENNLRGSERYNIPVNASGAAYLGYQRAGDDRQRGEALAVVAQALARRSYWRPALDAYKTSLALNDNATVRQAYDELRATRGFRITNYKVENESASPRLCVEFSEPLKSGKVDFSTYVSVDGKDPQGVSAEGSQLCIDGMKHGERFEVSVRAGLPAEADDVLAKTSQLAIYVRDRSPTARFSGRSYVLPSRGQAGIPIVSINTSALDVKIYRVGDRGLVSAVANGTVNKQLSQWELRDLSSKTGQKVYEGRLAVRRDLNKEVTTAIPVSEAVPQMQPGVYAVVATPVGGKDSGGQVATQWFVVSDLGLTAFSGTNGVHVFVRSLATADPVAKTKIRLMARNNEVLGETTTDAKGYARFDAGLGKGEGGLAPALIIAQASGGDYAFLDMAAAAFDLTDRGVKGRAAPGPIDGYIYTERGVYRPGEEVNLTALIRDRDGRASAVPVTLILARPDGVEHKRYTLRDQGSGGRTTAVVLADSAMTGTWRVRAYTDPKADPVATAAFLVEDFVPERLALRIEPKAKQLVPGSAGAVNVTGKFLYGPPAADLALEGEVVVTASNKDVAGFPGYKFGLADERIDPVREVLENPGRTGKDGTAALTVQLPQIVRTARPLEAQVIVRLREPGGRTIERDVRLPVAATVPRIGIKSLFKGDALEEGETASFDVIGLDADGRQTAMPGLEWELVRLDRRWQWYKRDGTWAYDSVTISRKIASGDLDARADTATKISSAVTWGRYRLDVRSKDGSGPASSMLFTAGWYATEDVDSPEMLAVALDKDSYAAGDSAKLKISSRHGGRALISVFSNGLATTKDVMIKKGDDEVALTVGKDWGAGAYVVAALYRPMDIAAKRMPQRALGVAWLGIDQKPRTFDVALDVPEKVRSGTKMAVPIRLGALKAGESAYVTVAAVDLGVLNLTRFNIPAPETWFYAQRLLGSEYRDLYGRLIDGMRAERGALKVGGDGSGGVQGNPPVEETVSLFSGIVKADADGNAQVTFEMPDFNGTVRVMAVAWSGNRLGHASKDVIVRDPVALTAAGPRFLTLGDKAQLQLSIHNVEGPAADYKVSVQRTYKANTAGGANDQIYNQSVALKPGERKSQALEISPQQLGLVAYDVRITGPDGIDVERDLLFDVKPPARDVRRVSVSSLSPEGGKVTVSKDLLTDLIAGRSTVSLSVGPLAQYNVPALLTQLDRYPYGCAEQTTSKALPLLYANALSVQSGGTADSKARERVQKAIAHLFSMQNSAGSFGIWGPNDADMWLTAYVTDFLSRARDARYVVDNRKFSSALDRLQNFVSYVSDFKSGGEKRAYALYVLARNGRAPIGELRYYADTRLERFSTPLAKAQIGAALAMMGDKERAERAFSAALTTLGDLSATGARRDFGSGLRDGAAVLTLASETKMLGAQAANLSDVLAKAFGAKTYTSTQEKAWMLLAANAMSDRGRDMQLSVNGKAHKGTLRRTLSAAELENGALVITNADAESVDAVISVVGAALTPEPAISRGFKVERSYYTLDGEAFDLTSANGGTSTVAQSERLVAVVKITAEEAGGRVLLVDRLPAGFEIENPRLVTGGDVKALSWLKPDVRPVHTEFRDDRFVAAFDFFRTGNKQRTATIAYIVRAVTPGSFVHPAAFVEDMYRPEHFARSAGGRLIITKTQ